MEQRTPPRQRTLPWGWIGFFLVVLLLALLSTFALLRGGRQLAQRQGPEAGLVQVILYGREHYLDPADAAKLAPRIDGTLGQWQRQAIANLETQIDTRIGQAFALVQARVPVFADWYYSLQGEYMRYAHALVGDMGVYLQRRMQQEIFQGAGLEQALDGMVLDWDRQAGGQLQAALEVVSADLSAFLTEHARPSPMEGGARDLPVVPFQGGAIDLDPVLGQTPGIGGKDLGRQAVSALAAAGFGAAVGKGLGAVVVKKAVASVAATKSFQTAAALLTKLAAKMALKGGGSAGAAATGLVLCSPGGPAALVCGAVAGLIAWVTVDKVFIELDEALNREQFEADLRLAVQQQQERLQEDMKGAYRGFLEQQFAQMQGRIQARLPPPEDFVPADAVCACRVSPLCC